MLSAALEAVANAVKTEEEIRRQCTVLEQADGPSVFGHGGCGHPGARP